MSFPWCDNFAARINIDLKYVETESNKIVIKDEEAKEKETVAAVNALLNSEGGVVKVSFTDTMSMKKIDQTQKSIIVVKAEVQKSFIRKIEQVLVQTAGLLITSSKVNFTRDANNEWILVQVESANDLIISNTHLYLPTVEQVNLVCDADPKQQTIREILSRKTVENELMLDSHLKVFFKDGHSGLHESKVVQFKLAKGSSENSKAKLADRITGKGNKFSCYVSAFANHQGGHIYYGIKDDGIVEGEAMSSRKEKEIDDITRKVEKSINKMKWPMQIGQPKKGVNWEIFFVPVVDENNSVVELTFVIIIYIARCLGGVFTEEPECYQMVKGKVEKMSFEVWKRRMLFHSDTIFSTPARGLKGVTRIQVICTMVNEILTGHMNNGKSMKNLVRRLEVKFPGVIEVQLVILSKEVVVNYRIHGFKAAKKLLEKYDGFLKQLKKTSEYQIFDAVRALLQLAINHAERDVKTLLKKALADALDKAEKIPQGLVTAEIYFLAAKVKSLLPKNEDRRQSGGAESVSSDLILALEHLQNVQESPILRVDMEQKIRMTLALFYLGCNASTKVLTKQQVQSKSLEKAKSSLNAVSRSIHEGNPMNRYRELQFNLVQSVLLYRHSQIQPRRKFALLQEAFNFSKKVEQIACSCRFSEMLQWAQAYKSFYTESLSRDSLSRANSFQSSVRLFGSGAIQLDDERMGDACSYV